MSLMKRFFFAAILWILNITQVSSLDFEGCDPELIEFGGLYVACPFTYVPPFTITSNDYSLDFSLGTNHVVNCDKYMEVWGVLRRGQALCVDIAQTEPEYKLIDKEDPSKGYTATFTPNSINRTVYQLIITLECNQDVVNPLQTNFTITNIENSLSTGFGPSQNNVIVHVNGGTAYGCPVVSFGGVHAAFEKNATLVNIIIALLGLSFAFFGIRFFKIIVFLVVTILGTTLFGGLLYEYSSFGSKPEVIWAVVAFSIIMGLTLGVISVKVKRFSYFVLGAALGGIGGSMLYYAILAPILLDTSGTAPFYIVIALSSLIVGIIYIYLIKGVVVISTSLIGAYIFVRAISQFIGGFPTAPSLGKGWSEFTPTIYAYLAGIILIAGIGVYIQCNYSGKKNPEKPKEEIKKPSEPADEQEKESLIKK